jgi:hypothetical protein
VDGAREDDGCWEWMKMRTDCGNSIGSKIRSEGKRKARSRGGKSWGDGAGQRGVARGANEAQGIKSGLRGG